MLTPKTNSRTFWPEEVSQEMNGITCGVFSIWWISRCILAAISVISDDQVRKQSAMSKRSEDDFEWKLSDGESETVSGATRAMEWGNLFTKFGISGQSGECRIKKRRRTSIQATGATRLQFKKSDILKRSDKRMFRKQPGNRCWRIKQKVMRECILTPQAHGNLLHRHQSWKTWNTRTINTWARSFSVCGKCWECPQLTQHFRWIHTRPKKWHGDCF